MTQAPYPPFSDFLLSHTGGSAKYKVANLVSMPDWEDSTNTLLAPEVRRHGYDLQAMTAAQVSECMRDSLCVWCRADYYQHMWAEPGEPRRCGRCGQVEYVPVTWRTMRACMFDWQDRLLAAPLDTPDMVCVGFMLWPWRREPDRIPQRTVPIRVYTVGRAGQALRTHYSQDGLPVHMMEPTHILTRIGAATPERAVELFDQGYRSGIEVSPGEWRSFFDLHVPSSSEYVYVEARTRLPNPFVDATVEVE